MSMSCGRGGGYSAARADVDDSRGCKNTLTGYVFCLQYTLWGYIIATVLRNKRENKENIYV